MKSLIISALAILAFASCHKKKTYCICRIAYITEIDRVETGSAEQCAQRQATHRAINNNADITCMLEED